MEPLSWQLRNVPSPVASQELLASQELPGAEDMTEGP